MSNTRPAGARLNRSLYCTLIGASGAMWISGVIWLVLHNFARTEGKFGIVSHPLEPVMLQVHGFILIPALLSLGGIVFGHIGSGWRYKKNKISGLLMLSSFAILIGTGYVLYYTGSDLIRQASSLAHWIIGLAAPALFVKHAVIRAKLNSSTHKVASRNRKQQNPALAA